MYVQGMNEILATLYYCFWQSTIEYSDHFESDLFFCFTQVMSDLRDGFIRTMDSEESGINGKIARFQSIFNEIDPVLQNFMEASTVTPNFYSLRWLMLMMAQEFELLNVIRLWDTLLADRVRWNFIFYICVASVQLKRSMIMGKDFSDIMEALQKQSNIEVNFDLTSSRADNIESVLIHSEGAYIEKLLEHAKKICVGHTRHYDYFIEAN
eukprot:CAMPEP_0170483286 /NCGR_PEP_ID=MMETSP0208-20121228/2981_1 /TAXON_ID=197538 /ORGANISM="Strombidium inclinatum, Strain S3" /LENGTH=209 /DNA_ID=CAMNT_0010756261 /DNA_START=739 /DNA_END=1368 /DNA_ORIENTATION=+